MVPAECRSGLGRRHRRGHAAPARRAGSPEPVAPPRPPRPISGTEAAPTSIDLERLLRDLELQHKGKGTIGGRADLETHGNSLRQMAAHLDGELGFLLQDGELGETLLELIAIDFGEAIVAHVYGNRPAPVQ